MISVICRRLFCRMIKTHPACLNPVTNPWPINCPNKGGRCENEQLKSWNLQARAKEKSKGRELAKMLRNLPEMSRRIDIRWFINIINMMILWCKSLFARDYETFPDELQLLSLVELQSLPCLFRSSLVLGCFFGLVAYTADPGVWSKDLWSSKRRI